MKTWKWIIKDRLDRKSLLNIFKIETSTGDTRPKILISEEKKNREDDSRWHCHFRRLQSLPRQTSCRWRNKLSMSSNRILLLSCIKKDWDSYDGFQTFRRQTFCYTALWQARRKKEHVLTASGLTGWDYKSTKELLYKNLFKLCSFLKITPIQIEELFKRMEFHMDFGNIDEH
jgi:serine/threonine-protein kinase HipA